MERFDHLSPSTPTEAVRAIARTPATARFLAGGTTIVDLMKLEVERPITLVDISRIGDLRAIGTDGGELVFGALAHMSDVADNAVVKRDYPLLSEALWKAASSSCAIWRP